jgi:hypothetical protein
MGVAGNRITTIGYTRIGFVRASCRHNRSFGEGRDRPCFGKSTSCSRVSRTRSLPICSIPDDHIDPRRSALFMARSVLGDILENAQC